MNISYFLRKYLKTLVKPTQFFQMSSKGKSMIKRYLDKKMRAKTRALEAKDKITIKIMLMNRGLNQPGHTQMKNFMVKGIVMPLISDITKDSMRKKKEGVNKNKIPFGQITLSW